MDYGCRVTFNFRVCFGARVQEQIKTVIMNKTRLGYALSGTCLKMDRWREIHELFDTAGCDLVFGVKSERARRQDV